MSDPTERVREILADIRDALGGSTNTALLEEIRYLNRALTGGDALNAPVTAISNWGLLRDLLARRQANESGVFYSNVTNELSRFLSGFTNTGTYEQLNTAISSLNTIAARLQDNVSGFSVARSSGLSYGALESIAVLLGIPSQNRPLQLILEDILAATGAINTAPGGFTQRDLLGRILIEQTRAADCCEEGGTGGDPEPAPAADPTACGEGFATGTVVSEYVPGDYSAPEAMQEGLAIVPGSGSTFTDVAAPWAPSKRAFRVTGATSAFVCLQCTLAPGDTGQYGISIQGRLVDGSPAFTPGGFAQNFPPSGSYTSVLISEDSGGFDVYWFLTVYRVSGPGGGAESYSGPPARIFLTEGTLT